jgi:hypothetical protein
VLASNCDVTSHSSSAVGSGSIFVCSLPDVFSVRMQLLAALWSAGLHAQHSLSRRAELGEQVGLMTKTNWAFRGGFQWGRKAHQYIRNSRVFENPRDHLKFIFGLKCAWAER